MSCAGFICLTPGWQTDIRFPADVVNNLVPTFKPHRNRERHSPVTMLHACPTVLYKFQIFTFWLWKTSVLSCDFEWTLKFSKQIQKWLINFKCHSSMPTKVTSVNESLLESGRTGWFIWRKTPNWHEGYLSIFITPWSIVESRQEKWWIFQRQSSKIR